MKRLFLAIVLATSVAEAADETFDCMIEPKQIVEIRSPVVGLIETIHVRRGERVRKGQTLVTIDSGVERSAAESALYRSTAMGALQVAESKLAAATDKAARQQALFEDNFVSAQARDEAEADRRTAQAEVKSARENLEMARLEYQQAAEQIKRRQLQSPITGVVMDQYLNPGSVVDSGEGKKPILKLAETNHLRVETRLGFQSYNKIIIGMQAKITPEKPLTGAYTGTVSIIDSVIDSASGTFGVVIDLENESHNIPAGVRCKVGFASLGAVQKN